MTNGQHFALMWMLHAAIASEQRLRVDGIGEPLSINDNYALNHVDLEDAEIFIHLIEFNTDNLLADKFDEITGIVDTILEQDEAHLWSDTTRKQIENALLTQTDYGERFKNFGLFEYECYVYFKSEEGSSK